MSPDDLSRAYASALRILDHRFNSEAELRRKLARKAFDAESIDATIAKLRAERWLDDERFAAALVRTRANKRVGRNRILRELQAAGVESTVAREAVGENMTAEGEIDALRELARKRARLLIRRHGDDFLESAEGRNKLTVYLLNQGYDAALVQSVVKEIRGVQHQ